MSSNKISESNPASVKNSRVKTTTSMFDSLIAVNLYRMFDKT